MQPVTTNYSHITRRVRQRNLLTAGLLVGFVGGVYLYTSQKMKATVS